MMHCPRFTSGPHLPFDRWKISQLAPRTEVLDIEMSGYFFSHPSVPCTFPHRIFSCVCSCSRERRLAHPLERSCRVESLSTPGKRLHYTDCFHNPCRARSLPQTVEKKLSDEVQTIPYFFQFPEETRAKRHCGSYLLHASLGVSVSQRVLRSAPKCISLISLTFQIPVESRTVRRFGPCTTSGDSCVPMSLRTQEFTFTHEFPTSRNWRWHSCGSEI